MVFVLFTFLLAQHSEPLLAAVERGDVAAVEEATRAGGLDRRDSEDRTALMIAAWKGSLPMARLLIAAGADVNATTKTGLNAMAFAQGHQAFRWEPAKKGDEPVEAIGLISVTFEVFEPLQ